MLQNETLLWNKLKNYSIDSPNESFSFSQRLAQENGWTADFTQRVITEYKKFLFLCVISPKPVTPSDEVDQAWHLHLVYTKSYWDELCKNILGKDIHHTPTQGGSTERDKFADYYTATLQLYQKKFSQLPPKDIWPPASQRFSNIQFVRANKQTHWLVPKFRISLNTICIVLIFLGLYLCIQFSTPLWILLSIIAGIVALAFSTAASSKKSTRDSGGSGCTAGCDSGSYNGHHGGHHGDSGCGGNSGCGGDSGCGSGCGGGD